MTTTNSLTINAPTTLDAFNIAPTDEATNRVLHWCAAPVWAAEVVAARPYTSLADLATHTTALWQQASRQDCLTAFAAHPVIGDVELLRAKFGSQANLEQGQVLEASDNVIDDLARQNLAYRDRHQFTFIVFATGKSAQTMLGLLNERIDNTTDQELKLAAAEQLKIMQLRLQQTISSNDDSATDPSTDKEENHS